MTLVLGKADGEMKFRLLSPLLGNHNQGQINHMVRREKMFKKPC
jgi:hypothetical protein